MESIWYLDPLTGKRWPGAETFAGKVAYRHAQTIGDVKFVWEINRLQFLQPLAAAGRFEEIARILDAWMRSNPPYRGINWTNGIEAASRVLSLLIVLAHTDSVSELRLLSAAKPFLEAHAYWIARYPSLHSSANNHRVAELAALFLVALALPGMPGAARYSEASRAGLEKEVLQQFHSDGVGAEQSPTYAAYSAEWFVMAAEAAKADGHPFSTAYVDRLRAVGNHFRWLMDDAGNVPRVGDDDEGRVVAFDQSPECYVSAIADRIAALTGKSDITESGSKVFASGGYTVVRKTTAKGMAVVTFDHGPLGFLSIAAHGHADALAIWMSWGNEPVLVDAGTYLYHAGGAARDHFRGTTAHNTLAVEDADQSTVSGAFNWSRHAKARIIECGPHIVTAEHDGYAKQYGVIHRRSLSWGKTGSDFTITDSLHSLRTGAPINVSLGFNLPPKARTALEGNAVTIILPKGRVVRMTTDDMHKVWQEATVPYSRAFGVIEDTTRLILRARYYHEAGARPISSITLSPIVE